MRHLIAGLALAFAVSVASPLAASAAPSPVAPATQRFGSAKLTVLQMRERLADLSSRAEAAPADAPAIFAGARAVEAAMRDWQALYPSDPWIPTCAYTLAELYGKLKRADAQARRAATLDWLVETYPQSDYAAVASD
ncbi:MAG TPA: hypothetical protein VFB22_02925 [Candidatus Baltobacteraceae bacterium]|nr:hypothetical protein [Candidatus Baltobacteraceae bacterium]